MYGSHAVYSANKNTYERDQKEAEELIEWVKQCEGKLWSKEFKKDTINTLSDPYTYRDVTVSHMANLRNLQKAGYDLDEAYGLPFNLYSVFFHSGLDRAEFDRLNEKYKFESIPTEDTILALIKSKYKTRIDGLSYQETDGMLDFTKVHKLPEWVTSPKKARSLLKGIECCNSCGIDPEVLTNLPEDLVSSYLPKYGVHACLVYLIPTELSAERRRVRENYARYNKVLFKVGRGTEHEERLLLSMEELFYGFSTIHEMSRAMRWCNLVVLTEGDTVVLSSTGLIL